ncbi:ABC transporter substrate-binding protein [Paraglaciecola marina]|uniref:ABC transporter substrate-binding protein n=1 Tax=Paraglaciecola marina TaxID=2500157 RepID=UPI00105E08AF|nr:ABC transporter substrate-binding protein [Paraglaciecola marina]
MKIVLSLIILFISQYSYAMKVVMVVPVKKHDVFWETVHQVSVVSAKSLGVELEVVSGGVDRFSTLELIDKITSRQDKPDYIIFRPFHGNAIPTFNKIEASGISFITLEQPVYGDEALQIKKPQQKYKHWIGEVVYNNNKAGQQLLDALFSELTSNHANAMPSLIGIGGNLDNLSASREFALTKLASKHDSRINQIFPTYWVHQNVAVNFKAMMARYPKTNIFWCASDKLALEVLKQHQLQFGKSGIIGGFDWLPEALEKIKQGQLTASMGGHFLMGAIAITKAFDYHHGIDRFEHPPYDFELITKHNVENHLDFMQKKQWHDVDYNQFSAYKAGKEPIKLTMKNLLKATTE